MSKRGCLIRMFKIVAGIMLAGILLIILLVHLGGKDYSLQRSNDARDMVSAAFGNKATTNEYFVVFGFLQGNTCYYRFETTPEAVQGYIKDKGLLLVTDNQAIREFRRGSPYWWKPGKGKYVEYYGRGKRCVISWDKRTGRCYILLHGG